MTLVMELNRLYRSQAALHVYDVGLAGFEWVDANDDDHSVYAFLRKGTTARDVVLIVFNCTPVPRHDYRIGVPLGGSWREILNTDATAFGGSGMGNFGAVTADEIPFHNRPLSLRLTLPPLAALYFSQDPGAQVERAGQRRTDPEAQRVLVRPARAARHADAEERTEPEGARGLDPYVDRHAHHRMGVGIREDDRHVEAAVDTDRAGAQHDRQTEHQPERRAVLDRQVGPQLEPQLGRGAARHRPAQVHFGVGDAIVVGAVGLGLEGAAVAVGLGGLTVFVEAKSGPHADLQLVGDAAGERQVEPEAGDRSVVRRHLGLGHE